MPRYPATIVAAVMLVSGCVSTRYKAAPSDTPPPAPLSLTTSDPTARVSVQGIIVIQGPGSWKREAYWDEYLVTIANRSPHPLVVESAELVDFQNAVLSPGQDPWVLEKDSRDSNERLVATIGDSLRIGGGVLALGIVPIGVGGMAALGGSALGATVVIWTWPAIAAASLYRNVSSRHAIEDEFSRRRLKLPLTLAPGATVEGSLFFRIAPGPRRLAIVGRAGPEACRIEVSLTPLAGLHLRSTPHSAPP